MKGLAILIAIGLTAASIAPTVGFAQSPSPTAPVTGIKPDRTTADPATRKAMREKALATRQKRADCRKQAREQKISLLKRRAFVKDCMAR